MADTSLLKNFNATCGGGLVLNKDVYDMQPGEAIQLTNFEPSTEGGYRRLNGTTKYNSTIVPQVSLANERIQMSAIFNSKIIAARGGTVVYGDTSGSWTSLGTSKGTTYTYDFDPPQIQDSCMSSVSSCSCNHPIKALEFAIVQGFHTRFYF